VVGTAVCDYIFIRDINHLVNCTYELAHSWNMLSSIAVLVVMQ